MNKKSIYFLLFFDLVFGSIKKQILNDSPNEFKIKITIELSTEADLFPTSITIGLPNASLPETDIQFLSKSQIGFQTDSKINKNFEWINNQIIQNLYTSSIRISPIASDNEYYKVIIATFYFQTPKNKTRIANSSESIFLKGKISNWNTAEKWFIKKEKNKNRSLSLANGNWIQFSLDEDGINSIKYETINEIYPSINDSDPRSFSIFTSSELGRSRTQDINQEIPENLVEIAIDVEGEDDGSFDLNDKIIFYGRGPSGFDIIDNEIYWHQNVYFTKNTYWLFIPNNNNERGLRVQNAINPSSVSLTLDYGISALHNENDFINLEASGTEWVSSPINSGNSQVVITSLSKPKIGVDTEISARLRGFSSSVSQSATHNIYLTFDNPSGQQIGGLEIWSGTGARIITNQSQLLPLNDGTNLFYINNSTSDAYSSPYLDYFQIKYGRQLYFGNEFEFFSPTFNQDLRYTFSGTPSTSETIWNITNIRNPENQTISSTNTIEIISNPNSISRFIVFDKNNLNYVNDLDIKSGINFNTLRNSEIQANYIIIGPKQFQDAAEPIIQLRSPAIYADIETIYQEFSAGNKDPMAIRSFIQWTKEYWISPEPICLLLLGDSGYDYRNITGNSTIIIPTIQVQSSRTYASDDLFATITGNIPEIAIGRFPARNESEVLDFNNKVIAMEENPDFGAWRQLITLVADDASRPEPQHGSIATGKSHTLNSEELANLIPSAYRKEKIYMLEYPEVSDASLYGVQKPDATEAVIDNLNKGTAIFSYIGHGSPYSLAQEKLLYLDRGDINQINTGKKMPLWIVGTCSFGHFDDPTTESFAEELIRAPMNAASMIISTTRKITISGNERYTYELFNAIFENGIASNAPIGVILQSIKDGYSEGQYFHLFGDPAMKLPLPKNSISINNITPDTLKTLEIANIYGNQQIFDGESEGIIYLLDAEREVTREYQIYSDIYSLSYSLPGATLFRGQFTFSENNFSTSIIVPQDISYSDYPSRIVIYTNNDSDEACGNLNNIQIIGGMNTNDQYGPQISFETITGRRLETFDHLPSNENLYIRISDPLGINITNETGHEILITDLDSELSTIITDDFYYDQNSIQTGTIELDTDGTGKINIEIKAWDNANNPSEKKIILSRTNDNILKIYNAYNYPNPFSNSTQFTFEITNNAEISLDIFSLAGRRIRSFLEMEFDAGYHTIDWDGTDAYGSNISNGVYLYRIKAKNLNTSQTYIGRCAKFD